MKTLSDEDLDAIREIVRQEFNRNANQERITRDLELTKESQKRKANVKGNP